MTSRPHPRTNSAGARPLRRPGATRRPLPDHHDLYEAAVQGAEYDLDFMERVYRRLNGRTFVRFREDFCGTALVAASWALRRPQNEAWGVDLDHATLEWARTHRLARIGAAQGRVRLLHRDVREVASPAVDVVAAYNYSYWVFHRRRDLMAYFRAVHRSLRRGGLFFVSAFGGSEAQGDLVERKRVTASRSVDGEPVPAFTYIWEQRGFNVVDHRLMCYIHFQLRNGARIERAFTYDWRLWTLPEVRDALEEAGFRDSVAYVEGWDEKRDRPDEVFRPRKRFPNQESWLAVAVGVK